MLENLLRFFRDFTETLTRMAIRIRRGLEHFLEALLRAFRLLARWLEEVVKRIIDYLAKLLPEIARSVWAMIVILLFYIPSFIAMLIYWWRGSIVWLILGIGWFILITLIALLYRD